MVRIHPRQLLEDEPVKRAGTASKADRTLTGLGSMPSVFRFFAIYVQPVYIERNERIKNTRQCSYHERQTYILKRARPERELAGH